MPNPLEIVRSHARTLKSRFEQALRAGDMAGARKVGEEVFWVDPACREVFADVRPVTIGTMRAEWLTTKDGNPHHRLLYIHGGGWCVGSLESHRPFASRIARATGCAVLLIDYRLAPDNPYPAGLDDCVAGYAWMLDNGPDGRRQAERMFISGDSAGGGLTLTTALRVRDEGLRSPHGLVPISPGTDFLCESPSMESRRAVDDWVSPESVRGVCKLYLQNGEDLRMPYASPLYDDMHDVPPAYFQCGGLEILMDDSTRFVAKARAAGREAKVDVFEGMPHVFQGYAPVLPEALDAIERIGAFVKSKR